MKNTDGATAAAFAAQDPTTAASSTILEKGRHVTSKEGLPSFVVLEIFRYLDLKSLVKCRLVCSGFQFLIDSTASLQYKIELAVAGQRDGSYGDMFTRREMLKIHQKRWDELQWTEVLRVPMLSNCWGVCGGVLSQASTNRYTLHLKRIPSHSRRIKEKTWILDLLTLLGEGVRMGNFGMDPGQDLLVIIARAITCEELIIFLLTLSMGESHPLTSKPWLEPHGLGPRAEESSIGICHDFLSIHFLGDAMLWNWKTGQVLMHIVDNDITSIVFLNERYVLMAVMGEYYPYLLAVDFLAEPPERRGLDEVENSFIFRFPDISSGVMLFHEVRIIIRTNPRSTCVADTNSSVPFSMVPENRLFVVYLSNNMGEDLCFAILEASFLSLIKTGLRVDTHRFDWFTWGPEHGRIISNCPYSSSWRLPLHGTMLTMDIHLPNQGVLVDVYDFNPLGCRNRQGDGDEETRGNVHASASSEIIEGRPVCVLAPTRIMPIMFLEPVNTRLGYRVTSWSVSEKTHAMSISATCSEDAVIIVDEDNRIFEIYTI